MKIDKKASFVVFIVFAVAATVLRTLQLSFNVKFPIFSFRFGLDLSLFWMILFTLGLILFLLLILGRADDKVVETATMVNPMRVPLEHIRSYPSIACGIFFLGLFAATVYNFVAEIVGMVKDKSPRAITIVLLVFMFGAMFDYLIIGISVLKKQGIMKGHGGWLISASIMHLVYATRIIIDVPLIASDDEQLLIMIANLMAALFFITAARFFVGYERSRTRVFLIFWAYMLSMLEACSVISRFSLLFFGSSEQVLHMTNPLISDAVLIVLPIAVAVIFFGKYKYKEMPKRNLSAVRYRGYSVRR